MRDVRLRVGDIIDEIQSKLELMKALGGDCPDEITLTQRQFFGFTNVIDEINEQLEWLSKQI